MVLGPYDASMDFAAAVVTPPYVAKPLRLDPFRGMMLSPARVGDPASARAFARPYRVGRRPAARSGSAAGT